MKMYRPEMMSEIAAEILPISPSAVLSGPTFAAEVARELPTAVTIASGDASLGHAFIEALGSSRFRPYLSRDPIGAEIGGAVKNVLAIACGIVVGRNLGDNARDDQVRSCGYDRRDCDCYRGHRRFRVEHEYIEAGCGRHQGRRSTQG